MQPNRLCYGRCPVAKPLFRSLFSYLVARHSVAPCRLAFAQTFLHTDAYARHRSQSFEVPSLSGIGNRGQRRGLLTLRTAPISKQSSTRSGNTTRRASTVAVNMPEDSPPNKSNGLVSRSKNGVTVIADKLEKPAPDNRLYRVIELANRMEALLIFDPETDKASAALDVNVGSFSDPKEMPGLAHAVEHMLFMGTKKYPEENDYNQYLAAHNGTSNAYTASTSTNYYFEVAAAENESRPASALDLATTEPQPEGEGPLYGALDRFAQFFVEPLFLEDTLDRELRSVDSENKKNLQSDSWRLHQLQASLGNPDHPNCQFSTGNWETLHDEPLARGLNLRDEFMKFYETHYSANRMKLVVLGRESLDVLEKWVVELFTPVKNKNLPRLEWNGIPLYNEDAILTQVFAKPVLDTRSMDLYFAYPDEEKMYDSQPSRYLSHLIGHEGPGSILAYVKEKGWVNDLSAGAMDVCPGAAYFNIHVRLTEEGLANYKEVIKIIFQYISMLNEHPPLEWIYDELRIMTEVDFRFKQNSSASSTASNLSSYMPQPWPRDRLLSCAAGVLKKFEPKLISEGLAHLTPETFRLAISCQDIGGWDKKEKWYGTEYKFEKMPSDFRTEIHEAFKATKDKRPAALYLPHPNEFIPTRLEMEKKEVSQPAKYPKLIRNDEYVRTWYKKDDQFWVPKALVNIVLRSPLAYVTPRCTLMAQMYCALVQDALSEYSYDADIAGLEYSMGSDVLGPQISLKGYNDKMPVLLEKILTCMKTLEVSEARFKIIKERWVRGFKNWFFKQPYHQVGTYRSWLTADKMWITEQFQTEIGSMTAADVQDYYPQLLEQLHIEVLATGNLRKEDARAFTDLTESILKPRGLPQSLWPIRRSLIVPDGSNTLYEKDLADPENINHVIEYVCYTGSCRDAPLRASALLFAQIADEPCYDQLRTKEQLGYIVFSTLVMNLHRMGFRVLVQSEMSPEDLEDRIEAFLDKLGVDIAELDDVKFEKQKQSLLSKIKEKPKNLKEEFNRFWGYIISESFEFEELDENIAEIEKLTKKDVLDYFHKYISPASPDRAKVSVYMRAHPKPVDMDAEEAAAEGQEADELDKLAAALCKMLKGQGLPANAQKLKLRLEEEIPDLGKVAESESEVTAASVIINPEDVVEALGTYLVEDEGVDEDTVDEMEESGQTQTAVSGVIKRLGLGAESTDAAKPEEESGPKEHYALSKVKPTPLQDDEVLAFKSGMQATSGTWGFKDVKVFEDIEPKL